MIGLEFAGTNCVAICRQALTQLLTAKYPTLPRKIISIHCLYFCFLFFEDFISQSPADARGQLDKFYNFASMQMFA